MEFKKKKKRKKIIDTKLKIKKPHTLSRKGGTTKMILTILGRSFLVGETHRLRTMKWKM